MFDKHIYNSRFFNFISEVVTYCNIDKLEDGVIISPIAGKLSEKETERVIEFLKEQGTARYDKSVLEAVEEENGEHDSIGADEYDEKYDAAVALVCETGQASISMVQRRLRVGYNRAARMIEIMEKEGLVGPGDGSKPREVLARKSY